MESLLLYKCVISILGTSNRIPTRVLVVLYTSCHGATFGMTNCTIVLQKCSSACYHGIWCHNSTNCHNSSTMTTCDRKYTWLNYIQQQMLIDVRRTPLDSSTYRKGAVIRQLSLLVNYYGPFLILDNSKINRFYHVFKTIHAMSSMPAIGWLYRFLWTQNSELRHSFIWH